MSNVYSARVIQFPNATPSTGKKYVVPASKLLILVGIDCTWVTGTPASGGASILSGAAGTPDICDWWQYSITATTLNAQWRGRVIYNAGETLYLWIGGGTVGYTANGYLLDVP